MTGDEEPEGPEGYVFAVDEDAYCCWEYDHVARTLEYLAGIDSGYFGAVASMLAGAFESDHEMAASIAIRASYQQGIEALMSLLGAYVQAPEAVPAWIGKCSTDNLKAVVLGLRDRRPLLTQVGRQVVDFRLLSENVHRYAWSDESGNDSTAARFGRFWVHLASELLDDVARAEYNAIKHGARVIPGGFQFAIGVEEVPGVPAPPEAMRSLGGSRFGSTFFVPERVGESRWHIRTRRTSVNWSVEQILQRLVLVSMSISNVAASLQCNLGVDPTTAQFVRPDPASAFEDVWTPRVGVRHKGMDTVIRVPPANQVSRQVLKADLEGRRPQGP